MENFGASGGSDVSSAVRKKRINTFCRPQNDSQLPLDYKDASSLSDVSKGSSDENIDCGSVTRKKEINLNLCSSRASFSNNIVESESAKNVIKNEDGGFGDSDEASNNVSFKAVISRGSMVELILKGAAKVFLPLQIGKAQASQGILKLMGMI